jgi:hypothetical protein
MARPAPKPENLAKLTPEQRVIYDGWVREAEATDVLIQQALDALAVNNHQAAMETFAKLDTLIPHQCEHGRHVFLDCQACKEIERILYPDLYDADGNFLPNEDEKLYQTTLKKSVSNKDLN